MTRIERARDMLGTPFLHLGRNRVGVDCVGLVAYAYEYPPEKIPSYPKDPFNNELERQLTHAFGPPILTTETGVRADQLEPEDLVAMAYIKAIRHVGIVAKHPNLPGQLTLIHTDSTLGRVTEHSLDQKWLRRIRQVYRQ